MHRWSPGDTVVVRYLARSDGTVATALPAVAIRDQADLLALYVPPGTVMMDNYIVAAEDRVAAVGQAPPSAERRHAERRWTVPTIRLYLAGEAFSVWAFFDDEGRFASWYGNLEAPFVRTEIGIDSLDHALDVVADAKGRWRWKDEEEFARRLELGLDTSRHQVGVRAAGEAFISRLEAQGLPFNQGWQTWRPPSDWAPRALPAGWRDDLGTATDLG
jgi:hypothetical protein